jgi:gliding motility-associated-like protein
MKTEADGSLNCMETSSQITGKSVSSFFSTGNIPFVTVSTSAALDFEEFNGGIGRFIYTFAPVTDCFQSCCENIDTDTTVTEVCNILKYKLPDNTTVNESGIYYIHYTTENGCDSTTFFDIRFAKKPVANLGQDVCLGDSTRLLLKADSGYYDYNWMGNSSGDHTYLVTQPGKYLVTITNSCGSAMDEIEVFRDCDFDVYIPTAFTPNNDGLNDVFGYPILNKNRFVNMTIYNRWGQKIFYSTDPYRGWDGKFRSVEQPTDIYVFLFELKSLDGKKIMKKGVFQLIR